MKDRILQRSPGAWQISYELGHDALGNPTLRRIGSATSRRAIRSFTLLILMFT